MEYFLLAFFRENYGFHSAHMGYVDYVELVFVPQIRGALGARET
jgi:hypothetical protein